MSSILPTQLQNWTTARKKQSDDFEDDTIPGIQQRYVVAVQKRVQIEVSKDNKNINNQWLLSRHLKQSDWWLRKEWYTWFIKKYNASVEKKEDKQLDVWCRAYYRDVHVWLPDVRWETTDKSTCHIARTVKQTLELVPTASVATMLAVLLLAKRRHTTQ